MLSQWKKEKLIDRAWSRRDECSAGEQAEGRRREEPYGVAVWEIADGDGQRAYNRWALREIITGSQKVTMNYSNNKFATAIYGKLHGLLFATGPIETGNKRRSLTSECTEDQTRYINSLSRF